MNTMRAFTFFTLIILISCNPTESNWNGEQYNSVKTKLSSTQNQFADYWYSGKAEVGSYQLIQSRYGESREGTASLIFVTEPFSKEKQVKLDDPDNADKVTVLKLNFTKNFVTGIYPYSMMLSVFTPVDSYNFPKSLKATMSSQEWCGQTFTQLNLIKNKYAVNGFSYFESEGDINEKFDNVLTEDELWNRIRINPNELPTGEKMVLPGFFYSRLYHKSIKPVKAMLTLKENGDSYTYTLSYESRTLEIQFEKSFPFKIVSWREVLVSNDGEEQITTGKLMKTLHIDYWNKNSNQFSYLRDSLNLN